MSSLVPEGWSRKKLGDSLIPRPKSKLPSGESNPLGYYDFYVCSHKVLKSFHNEYSSPSILFSTGGEASVHLATERYAFSTDVWATEFEGDICNEYVFRLLEENIRTINYSGFQGSGIKHLDKSFIEKLEFSIPPLPEQKKIASILTSVDGVIENTQKQIDKLQDLKKATMNELLTKGIGHTEFKDSELGRIPKSWEIYSLGELGQIVGGGTPSSDKSSYWGGSIMWATPAEITKLNGKYIETTVRTITPEGLQNSSAKLHPEGTILLTSRASIGYAAITTVPMATNQGFQSLRPNNKLNVEFGYQLLCDNKKGLERLSAGSTFQEISSKEVNRYRVAIPSLFEQKEIASILTSMDKTIEEKQRKLQQTQSLKKSLMQDLLTGKVRVTVN
jgi:type I restriction enzyme S subunit